MASAAAVCILLLVTTSLCDAVKTRQVRYFKYKEDDVIFMDSLLSTFPVKSMPICAYNCLSDGACVTFTFVNGTVPHECRLHNDVMASNSTNVTTPGAMTYTLIEWRDQPCGDGSQCVGTNWECYKGQCLCTPGYYYSLSTKECISICPVASLQSTYTKYTHMKLRGCNIEYRTESVEECKASCYSNTQCLTFEYANTGETPNCYLQNETPLTSPATVLDPYPGWDMYQKHCA